MHCHVPVLLRFRSGSRSLPLGVCARNQFQRYQQWNHQLCQSQHRHLPAQVSDIQNYAMQTPGISSSNATVSVLWCNSDGVTNCVSSESNAKPGNIVKVTVSYTFASVPFVSEQAVTLSSTSETVIWE